MNGVIAIHFQSFIDDLVRCNGCLMTLSTIKLQHRGQLYNWGKSEYLEKIINASHNKNIDIKFNVHDTFLESLLSGTLKVERLENQIILIFLGAIKPKGLNRIVKISYGHLYLCEA